MTPPDETTWNRGCFKRPGSSTWEFFYTNEAGQRTSLKGFSSLEETRKLRLTVRDRVRQKKLGVFDPRADSLREGHQTHIETLVEQFEKTKDNGKITEAHRKKLLRNIRDCITVGGLKRASSITKDAIEHAVESIRKEREWSHESANQMLKAMRSFTRWLHRRHIIHDDPLNDLATYNVKVDRHHDRRELTDAEITALFKAAMASRRHRDGGPIERYLLCRTALETGFRKEEFRPLTKARFILDGDEPGILLEAGEDKAKRGAVQPISKELAGMLARYLARVPDRKNILRIPYKTDQLMRRLCSRAKVAYCKGGLYADFHAWRHTFISRLANSTNPPVSLWVVKELARHASITTTERYVHSRPADKRAAVNSFGDKCAALALAQDGTVRDKLVQFGTVINGVEKDATLTKNPSNTRGEGHCAGRGSNPQPSASEAQRHSRAKVSKKRVSGKKGQSKSKSACARKGK